MSKSALSVVMLGATGAVGNHVAQTLASMSEIKSLTLLGRRPTANLSATAIAQHVVELTDINSYSALLPGHQVAICALGVGQPSKISKAEFVRIDHDLVLQFAQACKHAGVAHFELLSAVAADADSASFYLATKGKLERALKALNFQRLSLFQPSMIVTPKNRYGWVQGLGLVATRVLNPFLLGSLDRYRGINVERLGQAMALNLRTKKTGVETLRWRDFVKLASS